MIDNCMYCKYHDLFKDSNGDLRYICTKVESSNFFTETNLLDSCEQFK